MPRGSVILSPDLRIRDCASGVSIPNFNSTPEPSELNLICFLCFAPSDIRQRAWCFCDSASFNSTSLSECTPSAFAARFSQRHFLPRSPSSHIVQVAAPVRRIFPSISGSVCGFSWPSPFYPAALLFLPAQLQRLTESSLDNPGHAFLSRESLRHSVRISSSGTVFSSRAPLHIRDFLKGIENAEDSM